MTDISRRRFIAMSGAAALALSLPRLGVAKGTSNMYGLISKLEAVPGKRDLLISILLQGARSMPGCLSYVVARDVSDTDGIWITEVWDSSESHKASLSLPSVRHAMLQGKPLVTKFSERIETDPVGGEGL